MAVIGRSKVDAIKKAYDFTFNQQLANTPASLLQRLGLVYQINGGNAKTLNLPWMRRYAALRRWVNGRRVQNDEVFDYELKNTKYELTFQTQIDDIRDNVYMLQSVSNAEIMADAYVRRINRELADLLLGAFDNTQYTVDGKSICANDHPYGRFVFDSSRPDGDQYYFDQTGTIDNRTDAVFAESALWAARQAFLELKGFDGEPLNIMPTHLIVGPSLEKSALEILDRELVSSGESNVSQGLFNLVVMPELQGSDAGKWFLVAANQPNGRRPFVFWNREAPIIQHTGGTPEGLNDSGEIDSFTFEHDAIRHGMKTRMGFGYGAFELIYGSDGTA